MDIALTQMAERDSGIERIVREDFDGIVLRYQKRIYRILLAQVRDSDVADTLTQECFLRAFRRCRDFRGESSLFTWLVRIAINLAHDHHRSRRRLFWHRLERMDRVEEMRVEDAALSPEKAVIRQELLNSVRDAVGGLPHRQRTVFLLRYVEDMPLGEIASATGMRLGTVKTHLFRAVAAVRVACGNGRMIDIEVEK